MYISHFFVAHLSNEKKAQIVNLNEKYCLDISTIGHELMHAIGFNHEQSRPDRHKYVKYYPENLEDKSTLVYCLYLYSRIFKIIVAHIQLIFNSNYYNFIIKLVL